MATLKVKAMVGQPDASRPVVKACTNCRQSKLKCDEQRPCTRCIVCKKESSCIDYVPRPRGRKRANFLDPAQARHGLQYSGKQEDDEGYDDDDSALLEPVSAPSISSGMGVRGASQTRPGLSGHGTHPGAYSSSSSGYPMTGLGGAVAGSSDPGYRGSPLLVNTSMMTASSILGGAGGGPLPSSMHVGQGGAGQYSLGAGATQANASFAALRSAADAAQAHTLGQGGGGYGGAGPGAAAAGTGGYTVPGRGLPGGLGNLATQASLAAAALKSGQQGGGLGGMGLGMTGLGTLLGVAQQHQQQYGTLGQAQGAAVGQGAGRYGQLVAGGGQAGGSDALAVAAAAAAAGARGVGPAGTRLPLPVPPVLPVTHETAHFVQTQMRAMHGGQWITQWLDSVRLHSEQNLERLIQYVLPSLSEERARVPGVL